MPYIGSRATVAKESRRQPGPQSTTEYYRVLRSTREYYRVVQSTTVYDRVLESTVEYNRVLQSTTVYYSILQCTTEYYRVLEITPEHYRVLHSTTEYYRIQENIPKHSRLWKGAFSVRFCTFPLDFLCFWCKRVERYNRRKGLGGGSRTPSRNSKKVCIKRH